MHECSNDLTNIPLPLPKYTHQQKGQQLYKNSTSSSLDPSLKFVQTLAQTLAWDLPEPNPEP